MNQVVSNAIRESRKTVVRRHAERVPLYVSKGRAHCGCGWSANNADGALLIFNVIEHSEQTNHTCHFQGEVRGKAQVAA